MRCIAWMILALLLLGLGAFVTVELVDAFYALAGQL